MACIVREAECNLPSDEQMFQPIDEFADIAGTISGIWGIVSLLIAIAGLIATVDPETDVTFIEGLRIYVSTHFHVVGIMVGLLVSIILVGLIEMYRTDRCNGQEGNPECVAGLITNIQNDFNDIGDELFPFTAMHDRVDLLVKSDYWNVVERSNAFVYCTDDADSSRRSEIMRCYFYSRRVCSAASASLGGGMAGMGVAIVVDALIAGAIGSCSSVILCFLGLILLVIVAAIIVLGGAVIGGQVGRATAEDSTPTGENEQGNETVLEVGDYVTIRGNMLQRPFDNCANVLWWVSTNSETGELNVNQSGPAGIPVQNNPSYCEVNDEFNEDSCNI